jgi:histidinol dehydrogenase
MNHEQTLMKIYTNPSETQLHELLQRPQGDLRTLDKSVRKIMDAVRKRGDKAVRKFTKEFDGIGLRYMDVKEREFRAAEKALDPALKAAINTAARNIRSFHESQLRAEHPVETMPDVRCWRKAIPIQSVGLYIPGGTAPLFSTVLMLGIPAVLAGCPDIILCSPPNSEGNIHPAILFAAKTVGVTRIFKAGGVQAIAAMAYGTESIPRVHKIFGPGNGYVTYAKQLAQQEGVAIDMPAGPSEVCVLADATVNPSFVAADLLSQAEHGRDSQVLLVSNNRGTVDKVLEKLQQQLSVLNRKDLADSALQHSKAIVCESLDDCMAIVNAYAPEHLILACENPEHWAEKVTAAGSVFLGHFTPESAGDYASGTNHTLPTNGHARAYSGVSVDSYQKKVTFQQISEAGLRLLGPVIVTMAEAEGLQGHAEAVRVRLS